MNPEQMQRYISLCKKFYNDKEFSEFILLHSTRSQMLREDAWLKLLTDKSV